MRFLLRSDWRGEWRRRIETGSRRKTGSSLAGRDDPWNRRFGGMSASEKATCADIPIVLLTFRVGEESVSEGFASGCTSYLKKPIEPDDLISALRQQLGD